MGAPIVEIENGKLKGKISVDFKGGSFYSFQGIPYGKPPIGQLRFKSPLPAESWQQIKDATVEGNKSVSRDEILGNITGLEDCLHINVYTPQIANELINASRPVMVFIHGGLFVTGSGNSEFLGPEYLITGDIVVVTFNYRLGLLGFLGFQDPTLEASGNAALKDMVLALKWVQNNIEVFCGDPNYVTLVGHSAGAVCAHLLMLSPMTKGLFHRVIIQSGCALNTWARGSSDAAEVAKTLGYESTKEKDILQFLRSVSKEKIIEAQEKLSESAFVHKRPLVAPVIEKYSKDAFLSEYPIDIIKSGRYNKVPMIIGYCNMDGLISDIVYGKSMVEQFNDFERQIPHYYNIQKGTKIAENTANKIKEFYYDNTPTGDNLKNFYTMKTDIFFLLGAYNTINSHMENLNLPIYLYRCSFDTDFNLTKKLNNLKFPGTCHGDDIGYLFKNDYLPPLKAGSTAAKIIEIMVEFWTNFVRTGDPNPSGKHPLIDVVWDPVKLGKYNHIDINRILVTHDTNTDFNRMNIWKEISEYSNVQKF